MGIDLTIVILTKNEEQNIVDVIKNAHKVSDKVLIVDSGSTDKTVELAEANGAKVVYRAWDNNFAAQRNFALEYVQTEWVLYLDADERINDKLAEAIKKVMQASKDAMYRFIRRNSAFGKDFKYGALRPDSVIRMFPKNKVRWQDKVHERPVGDLPVITLKGFLRHYTYKDFDQYICKMNTYSTIAAQNYRDKNKNVGIIKDVILKPCFAFFKVYVLKKGFLDGKWGLILSVYHCFYTLTKYTKLYALYQSKK